MFGIIHPDEMQVMVFYSLQYPSFYICLILHPLIHNLTAAVDLIGFDAQTKVSDASSCEKTV